MISRTLAMPTLLAASVAVPYVATNAPQWSQQFRTPAAASPAQPGHPVAAMTAPSGAPAAIHPASAPPPGPGAAIYPSQTPVVVTPTYSLAEVFSFDVTREWVYQRWARKSTALAELDLYGVRVPLVSGTQLYDVAGSLTYFFGADGRVKRISFSGRTGDTSQLAILVHQRFGLQAQPTIVVGEQLLQARRDDAVISEMRTRTAPVLWASAPHDSFSVDLELQQPATARPLKSPQTPLPSAGAAATAPPAANAATAAAPGAKEATAATESPSAADATAAKESGWNAFFPRSRVPQPQVDNLNRGNLYQ